MKKFRKLKFENHPVLGNLELDFCGLNGRAVDTVIFAGENGCGKSTILNDIFGLCSNQVVFMSYVEWEDDNQVHFMNIKKENGRVFSKDEIGNTIWDIPFHNQFAFRGIFSDVDINFKTNQISSVTSNSLDSSKESFRSSSNFPTQIKQLIVDVQALDDAAIATAAKNNPDTPYKSLHIDERISRFTNAFANMFESLKYSGVENTNGHKEIFFEKYGKRIPLDKLSSGEKQIVYRGCFLLKDKDALNGAFVFIDEPEISLHPVWQKKIMDYYKDIFTDEYGIQTSQIFTVSHSPFVIHNENRKKDKVIVLKRNETGEIVVEDRPEYYDCSSAKIIQDAFSINDFTEHQYEASQSCVYLEGRTDEKYFNRAVEVFGYTNLPFKFKWVGYVDAAGQERFTGCDALNSTYDFLVANDDGKKNAVLFDCDTKRKECQNGLVFSRTMSTFENVKKMKKGIENALVLDKIDTTVFYSHKTKEDDYGGEKNISEFKKMDFCKYICSLDNETLRIVFANLKVKIDELIVVFSN